MSKKNFEVGDVVPGFGHGYFGRDSYEDKTCVHVGFYGGIHYAVFHESRYPDSWMHVVSGEDLEDLWKLETNVE